MNLTDNEIIKALECCNKGIDNCDNCPYVDNDDCGNDIVENALILINRLKAEIERLQHKNSELQHKILNCKTE